MNFIEQFYYENKKKVIIFIAVIIVFVLSVIFSNKSIEKSEYEKEFSNLEYVFTYSSIKDDKGEVKSKMPLVNLKGNGIDTINNDIMNKYNDVVKSKDGQVTYEYSINGKILSLLLTVYMASGGDGPYNIFYSYNIDMELAAIIPNSYMLKIKRISEDDIKTSIESKMETFYNYEVSKGYLNSNDCNLSCYLKERDMNLDDLSDISIYLNSDGDFVVYKTYNLSYGLIMDNNSPTDTFEFIVK